MKYILSLLMLLAVLIPIPAHADRLSPDNAWAFLYEFPLTVSGGRAVPDGTYRITTGTATALTPGAWTLTVRDGAGGELKRYAFDPASATLLDTRSLVVAIEHRGASVDVTNEKGQRVVSIDVRESRVCNDNHVCSAEAGERYGNCPTDCGGGGLSSSLSDSQTATVIHQIGLAQRAGGLLLRLSLGAAGLLLIAGLTRVLDSRQRS